MTVTGVNLRNTLAHATDGVGFTACTGTNRTYSAAQGFGWTSGPQSQRDRTYTQGTPYATQFAGMHYSQTNGHTFRLDLPNGAGTYKVYAIHADLGYNGNTGYRYKDGSTVIASVSGGTTSHGSGATYRDILDNSRSPVTDFDLPNENYVLRTFTNDHLLVERDTSLVTGHGVLSSVWVEPATLPTGLGDEKLWLCPSLDDSAGDISGNGNHGTYNGGMGTVADTSEGGTRAYSFNGSNQAISLTSTEIQQITTTGSFSAWAYLDTSVTAGFRTIFDRSTTWTPGTIALTYAASFDRLEFVTNTNGDDGFARYTITPANFTGQWWHVCGVLDGGNATLFLNGSQVAQDSTDSVPTTSTDQFVGATNITQNEWVGKIDDIRIFDRALTTSEITALASKRGYEVPQGTGPFPHPLTISIKHPLG